MKQYSVILGLGKTGLSCARYLAEKGIDFVVMDSRQQPPALTEFRQVFPDVPIYCGEFSQAVLDQAEALIISPGISLKEPAIARQAARGVPILGDIELFCREAKAPIIAITGSNGKSTVTALVGEFIRQTGLKVQVIGNIGKPVLDALFEPIPDFYVIELSSFQLETTYSLKAKAATVLNISPDHMDRYANLEEYTQAKQRIYLNCETAVYNRDDLLTLPSVSSQQQINFGLNKPEAGQFGIDRFMDDTWLIQGDQLLMSVQRLRIQGRHNWANGLAALALGQTIGLPLPSMLDTLSRFNGLPHRCQWVGEWNSVTWYNDSKATNVGASLAAITGLGAVVKGKLILIAGGQGKGADFKELQKPLEEYVRTVILLGQDADKIAEIVPSTVTVQFTDTMQEAVRAAKESAQPGDAVLLAPACASLDMFTNFEERGEVFSQLARALHE